MNIVEGNFKFKSNLTKRPKTNHLVLHHAKARKCTPDDIHQWHLERGWSGFGYHYSVSKDGTVTVGRPIDKMGAHVQGHNDESIGICFIGDYETERNMPIEQLRAGQELIKMIRDLYPEIILKRHIDLGNSLCPGKFFPFELMAKTIHFNDIGGHWSKKNIEYVVSKGYMRGRSNDVFDPDSPITRAEIAAVLKKYDEINK